MGREEIREGIQNRLCQLCWLIGQEEETSTPFKSWEECRAGIGCARCEDTATEILQDEHSQGVVIKVEGELPFHCRNCTVTPEWFDAGYAATESLIKEAK